MAKFDLKLNRKKVESYKIYAPEMSQAEAAAHAGIAERSFRRYKKDGRTVHDAILDDEIDIKDLNSYEKLCLELYVEAEIGAKKHQGKYAAIMRETAVGRNFYFDENNKRVKTNWVAAKEYLHMLTFATKGREDEQSEQQQNSGLGAIETPAFSGDFAALSKQQQAQTQQIAQQKRKENGDD